MDKQPYASLEMEVVEPGDEDVITSSCPPETPEMPF